MNSSRRQFALNGSALAAAAAFTSLPAFATNASEAKGIVDRSRATVNSFAANADFASVGTALGRARGVLIFPQVLRAGFVLGGSGGTGVLMVRDEKTGAWSGPAFYTMGSASLGFQAGASSAEMLMVINSQSALDSMLTSRLRLGGDASVALGPQGAGTGASITADFIVYARARGVFAGISVDGAVLSVRESLNTAFFGKPATPADILVTRTVSNPASAGLATALKKATK